MMHAHVKWIDGLRFAGRADSGHSIVVDGGKEGGGLDSAIHPIELLLVGLAGCTGMDVISILQKKKQAISAFEIQVHAEQAPDYPRRLTRIEVEFVVTGQGIDEAALRRAIALSEEKYCSVRATLQGSPEIVSTHRIVEASQASASA